MLHLAQVQKHGSGGEHRLKLLAQQKSDQAWASLPAAEYIPLTKIEFGDGALVLVELSSAHQINLIYDAAPWVVEVIQNYLSSGLTPELLQQEVDRAEQWRQALTLQSQELGRRALEMEARRDQIQDLEENLKREKKQLEEMSESLDEQKKQLDLERKQIDRMAAELKSKIGQ